MREEKGETMSLSELIQSETARMEQAGYEPKEIARILDSYIGAFGLGMKAVYSVPAPRPLGMPR